MVQCAKRKDVFGEKGVLFVKIAVCDDNNDYINIFEKYIEDLKDKKLDYDIYYSGEELLRAYEYDDPGYDAIFLDMEMGKLGGIETANRIRIKDKHIIIVFVTSHKKYMQSSFQCMPFRFLIKPISYTDFQTVYKEVCTK